MTSLPRIQRVAAYTLVIDSARLLLCRLSSVEKDAGKWTLPGGGMDWGEHPEETARREVLEETGLEVKVNDLAIVDSKIFSFPDRDMHALMFIYRAEVIGGTLTYELEGSTDFCEWFTKEEAEELPLVETACLGLSLAFLRTTLSCSSRTRCRNQSRSS